LGQLQSIEPQILELGYQIIAASTDRPEKLTPTADKNKLKYQLVSDNTMAGAKAFGIAFQVDAKMLHNAPQFKSMLEESSGLQHHLLPVPAVFLIGTDGVISFEYINPDYKIRLHPDVLLAAARALKK
jgi:peroxiredoxin